MFVMISTLCMWCDCLGGLLDAMGAVGDHLGLPEAGLLKDATLADGRGPLLDPGVGQMRGGSSAKGQSPEKGHVVVVGDHAQGQGPGIVRRTVD